MAKPAFVAQHRAEYEALRKAHVGAAAESCLAGDCARSGARRLSGARKTCRHPEFTGVRVLDNFPLATLREFIDWTPFFHTWELKGVYPRIFDHPRATVRRRARSSLKPMRCWIRSSRKT